MVLKLGQEGLRVTLSAVGLVQQSSLGGFPPPCRSPPAMLTPPVLFLSQVDKHIRRLDADLARFEADLKDKLEGSDFESSTTRGLKSK